MVRIFEWMLGTGGSGRNLPEIRRDSRLIRYRRWMTPLLMLGALTTAFAAQAATVWTGPRITFTKLDNANPALPANQDRLTPDVWITRDSTMGIFNIAKEMACSNVTRRLDRCVSS